MYPLHLAFHLVLFTGPEGQVVRINPSEVVSVREVRQGASEHFPKGAKCIIHTGDGKFIAVAEDCDTVNERLENAENEE